jgi:carbamoylphosphate synthase small subunit
MDREAGTLFDTATRHAGLRVPERGDMEPVQYHPEASPGPSGSHYLFGRFVGMMELAK